MNEKICVVVPCWDDYEQSVHTINFVGSMQECSGNWLLVVVDNASPSPITQEFFKCPEIKADPRIHVIHNSENEGYGRAANKGVQYGIEQGYEYGVVCNNDIVIENIEWLENSFLSHLRDHKNWLMGARLITDNGLTNFTGDSGGTIPYLEGWCLAFHKDLWLALEGMDEQMFNYFEDVDLSYRAVKAGYKLAQSPDFYWLSDGNLKTAHFAGGSLRHIGGQTGYANEYRFNWKQATIDSAKYFQKKWGFPKLPIAAWETN